MSTEASPNPVAIIAPAPAADAVATPESEKLSAVVTEPAKPAPADLPAPAEMAVAVVKRGRKPKLVVAALATPLAPVVAQLKVKRGAVKPLKSAVLGRPRKPRALPAAKVVTPKVVKADPVAKSAIYSAILPPVIKSKEKTMKTTTAATGTDFTTGLKSMMTEVQTKAKDAYTKSTAAMGDVTDFTKGNVEAIVASSKILATGMQSMSADYVADTRSAFETMTAEVKQLTTVTSPTEMMRMQGEMMRRSFDAAVAASSKNSEAMLKLVNEAFAPLSSRMSIAMEKIKFAA